MPLGAPGDVLILLLCAEKQLVNFTDTGDTADCMKESSLVTKISSGEHSPGDGSSHSIRSPAFISGGISFIFSGIKFLVLITLIL